MKPANWDPHGRLWHLVHVPLHWDDGAPTWKADRTHPKWQRFWQIIRSHVEAANRHEFGGELENEESGRANLSGVVFGDPPEDWLWHDVFDSLNAEFRTCAFLGRVSFSSVESTSELDFRNCLFGGVADFDRVNIKGALRLDGATFLSLLQMAHAMIVGDLDMTRCSFHGELSLLSLGRATCHFWCCS